MIWTGQAGQGVHRFMGLGTGTIGWSVVDLAGRTVSSDRSNAYQGILEIDLGAVRAGTYVMRVEGAAGMQAVRFVHVGTL